MPLIDAHFGGFFLNDLLYTQQKSVLDQIEHSFIFEKNLDINIDIDYF